MSRDQGYRLLSLGEELGGFGLALFSLADEGFYGTCRPIAARIC